MRKIEKIKYHQVEIHSEMAFAMAHCIGADEDNDQEIVDSFTFEEIEDCISLIRERLSK